MVTPVEVDTLPDLPSFLARALAGPAVPLPLVPAGNPFPGLEPLVLLPDPAEVAHDAHNTQVRPQFRALPKREPELLLVMEKERSSRCAVVFRDEEGFCYKITDVHTKASSRDLTGVPSSTLEERSKRWAKGMEDSKGAVEERLDHLVSVPTVKSRGFSLAQLHQEGIIDDDALERILQHHQQVTLQSNMVLPGVEFVDGFRELSSQQVTEALKTGNPIHVENKGVIFVEDLQKIVRDSYVEDIQHAHRNIGYTVDEHGQVQLRILDLDPDQVNPEFKPRKAAASQQGQPVMTAPVMVPSGGTQQHMDVLGDDFLADVIGQMQLQGAQASMQRG